MAAPQDSVTSIGWLPSTLRPLLAESRVLRGIIVVAAGHAGGYGIMLLATPILTRMYSPADFGVLATYTALVSLLGILICCRYEAAIPLPANRRVAVHLACLALAIAALATVLASFAFYVLAAYFPDAPWMVQLKPYWVFLVLNLFAYGCYQILTFWATRTRTYQRLAHLRLSLVLGTVVFQILLYAFYGDAGGLIAGQLLGYLIAVVYVSASSRGAPKWSVRPAGLLRAASRYRRFPLYTTWSESLNISLTVAPPLMLAWCYGATCAGWFVLAWRVTGAPLTLLVVPIARVYLAEASRIGVKDVAGLRSFFLVTLKKSALIATPAILALMLTATTLFPLMFGAEWQMSGRYCQLLCPLLLCHLFAISVRPTFDVTGRQDLQLLSAATGALLMLLAIFGSYFGNLSPSTAITMFSACGCVAYALSVYLCWRAMKTPK